MRHRAVRLRPVGLLDALQTALDDLELVFAWAGVIGRPIGWLRRDKFEGSH